MSFIRIYVDLEQKILMNISLAMSDLKGFPRLRNLPIL